MDNRQIEKDKLIKMMLDIDDKNLSDEEILHLLLKKKLAENVETSADKDMNFGAKLSDDIAKFAGSWKFIIIFTSFLILWMIVNVVLAKSAFDPYPFILLNLALSCVAALQAPVIMMSQNRQEEKDRIRSENDYEINLKSEYIIEDLHVKMDTIIENQEKILENVQGEKYANS